MPTKTVKLRPLLAIVGPTASGKSRLAVSLAKRFNGEVISADSRQVYRGLDIGSGKITRRAMQGVPHHLLNVASPRRTFSVAQYQRLALKALKGIWQRGKLPILCGGTGFYIDSVLKGTALPNVKPNLALRQTLEHKTTAELVKMLRRLDSKRAKGIDIHNRRRLVRAIEIATATGKVKTVSYHPPTTNVLILSLKPRASTLRRLITKRLKSRLHQGLIAEVRTLHHSGLSWDRLASLGLEYRYVSYYLQGKITKAELEQQLATKIWQFARRQMTWFRNRPNVEWVRTSAQAQKQTAQFLNKENNPSFK